MLMYILKRSISQINIENIEHWYDAEYSRKITLTSVISGLFQLDILTKVVCNEDLNSKYEIGPPKSLGASSTRADILAAALTWLGRLH